MEVRARWVSNGMPQKGWTLVDIEDQGKGNLTPCEWCHTMIRYVHHLEHPRGNLSSSCGCDCCEALTEDYITPSKREKEVRGRSGRLERWMKSSRWFETKSGSFRRRDKGVLAYKRGDRWLLLIGQEWINEKFASLEAAKRAAFEKVDATKRFANEAFVVGPGENPRPLP